MQIFLIPLLILQVKDLNKPATQQYIYIYSGSIKTKLSGKYKYAEIVKK